MSEEEELVRLWFPVKGIWEEFVEHDEIFQPDKWQEEVLKYWGDIVIRAGRQVGKSEVVSRKAGKFAICNNNTTTLILAASQRQSSLLFEKTRSLLDFVDRECIEKAKREHAEDWELCNSKDKKRQFQKKYSIYVEAPSMTKAHLKNGSKLYSLPAGKTGAFIRGFTLDLLILDEAAYISDSVWLAVKPMIAVSRKLHGFGHIIMLSTPFGKGGFFYDCFHDSDFRQWHISSENCRRIPREFLRKEKKRLSKVEYAQEYLGEFIDEFNQLFSTALCKSRMTFMRWDEKLDRTKKYYLGVDFARYGADETAFCIAEMHRPDGKKDHVKIIYVEAYNGKSMTDTAGRILKLQEKFSFTNIMVDDHGVGGGITDFLMEKLGRKILPLNNAKKTLDKDGRKGKLFKEDLYSNALMLMESEPSRIDIISNLKLLRSLRSVTFEYTSEKNLRIYGKYDHIAEAFVRACWCVKSKHLKLFIL